MRLRYDTEVNAASASLTDRPGDLPGPVTSVSVKVPENAEGQVILDFKYG